MICHQCTLEHEFAIQSYDISIHIAEEEHQSIESNRVIIGMQMFSADLQYLVVGSSVIIVVSRWLFWLAIFRSEDPTNDEYT